MNFSQLSVELVHFLRGKRSQADFNRKLGFTYDKVNRWESGRSAPSWKDFLDICRIAQAPVQKACREAYSYYGKLDSTQELMSHFVGRSKQESIGSALGVSRTLISRWSSGRVHPKLPQVLQLMHLGSPDFFRFIEILTKQGDLPSVHLQIRAERQQISLYAKYPWLSTLCSALDLDEYSNKPTLEFLAKKTRLSISEIESALKEMERFDLAKKQNGRWIPKLQRISIRGTVAERKPMAQYVQQVCQKAVNSGFGGPDQRFSWKIFSLNKRHYETLLQKYTEFFNDLGPVIDQGQAGADKVYLLSMNLVDYDLLKD